MGGRTGQKKNRADSILQEELTAKRGVAVFNSLCILTALQNRMKKNI